MICPSCPRNSPSPSSLHRHCLARQLRRPTAACPNCEASWNEQTDFRFVGEEAVQAGQDELSAVRRHHSAMSTQTQSATQRDQDEDEDDAEDNGASSVLIALDLFLSA